MNLSIENLLLDLKEEVSLIRKYLELQMTDLVIGQLDEIASTPERKMVWILLDESKTTGEIAEEVGISVRTVQQFLKELREFYLVIDKKRGCPQRRIDIIPSGWEKIERKIKSRKEETINGK